MKDPAFLFYSKDFYEGTRLMLPEERACYVDLLIYQHQNEIIPLDLRRVLLYCSGVDLTTLEATLEAKFIKTDKGYFNERLKDEVLKRGSYKSNQSDNGKVGQFWKKAKAILNQSDFNKLYKLLANNKAFVLEFTENNTIDINSLKGLFKQCLNNNVNVNVNVNANEDIIEKENEKEIKIKKPKIEIEKSKLEITFDNYLEMRKKIGKPATSAAIELAKKKIREYSKGDENRAVLIIEQSILNNWQGIFDLKENYAKPNQTVQEKTIDKMKSAFEEYQEGVLNGKY